MGSLAGMLKATGHDVRGSDQNLYPPMSIQLEAQQIPVFQGYRAENLSWSPELVVVGNAVPRTNPEVEALLQSGIEYCSMPQALGRFFITGRHSIVIAGTHGKTTTSGLAAWLTVSAGLDPAFLVGGVLRNFNASYRTGKGPWFVVEGDEYDTAFFDKESKFLHYQPRTAVITSCEFDHADIFRDIDAIKAAFRKFVSLVPQDGTLVAHHDDPNVRELATGCPGRVRYYSTDDHKQEWWGRIVSASPVHCRMEVYQNGKLWAQVNSPLFGTHNLKNILSIAAVADSIGVTSRQFREALESFESVRRRQEVIADIGGIVVIDDFAHHPTAVRETILCIRMRYPLKRVWAVFEPRTNTSRRKVFQKDYVEALRLANQIIVAPVDNPGKVDESERFSVEQLVADLAARGASARTFPSVDAIVAAVASEAKEGDVVLIMSNGGFGGIYAKLPAALESRR
ncbi:MAG: UDP-N-acetylmuramate:L-alanyl-gamma-D-glutamyl-meso-diaminopimelate ligase [Deltaproteobacteria bacterium]|nr:UDP-N-acetylmuramate:L-alanyl-gamma-D-glutamyl-meso-diaminopimelate ligase [Deltaproteobacteria bacterium]